MDAAPPAMETMTACGACGATMAGDQRYCLQCGTRAAGVDSALLERLRTSVAGNDGTGAAPETVAAQGPPAVASPVRPNGTPAVIAGVGVLLLSMGVGVLIGRAGAGSGRAATAPAQVITVAPAGANATSTPAPTTSTPATTTSTPSSTHKGGKSPSGVGSTLSKPAPPSTLQNLRKNTGQSYEQKSKNLPNVVSTG